MMLKEKINTAIPERFIWAADLLALHPSHRVMEIGCGVGVFAQLIASKLNNGELVAVDKSSFMIDRAKRRNKESIAKGTANFLASDFLKTDMQASSFDLIIAFNLNFFRKDPAAVLQLIKQYLKEDGKLYIFFQDPYEITISSADIIAEKLLIYGFTVVDTVLKQLRPTSAICVVAEPGP